MHAVAADGNDFALRFVLGGRGGAVVRTSAELAGKQPRYVLRVRALPAGRRDGGAERRRGRRRGRKGGGDGGVSPQGGGAGGGADGTNGACGCWGGSRVTYPE